MHGETKKISCDSLYCDVRFIGSALEANLQYLQGLPIFDGLLQLAWHLSTMCSFFMRHTPFCELIKSFQFFWAQPHENTWAIVLKRWMLQVFILAYYWYCSVTEKTEMSYTENEHRDGLPASRFNSRPSFFFSLST